VTLAYTLAMCILRLEGPVHRRINITLPEETLRLLDRVVKKGDRSRLIAEAVRSYVHGVGKANLRRQLKEGYQRNAKRSRRIAEEWFPLEEEAWRLRRR